MSQPATGNSTSSQIARFRFARRTPDGIQRSTELAEILNASLDKLADECWLFVSPHDDDLCIGAGLLMQAAVRANVDVQVLIVTDGSMGYCRLDQKKSIAAIRRGETYRSFAMLGISEQKVTYIDYPDNGLTAFAGRRLPRDGETSIEGYVGLQNAFTYYLRKYRPTRVFTPTHTDLHPDHRITYAELMISIFHAKGAIWPELGTPLDAVPKLGELAVYCDFAEPPNLEVIGDAEVFAAKLKSIEAYSSQEQIIALVNSTQDAGPYEYVHEHEFELFSPNNYKSLFADDE